MVSPVQLSSENALGAASNIRVLISDQKWGEIIESLALNPKAWPSLAVDELCELLKDIRMLNLPKAGEVYASLLNRVPAEQMERDQLKYHLAYLDLSGRNMRNRYINKQQSLDRIEIFLNSRHGPQVPNEDLLKLRKLIELDQIAIPYSLKALLGEVQPSQNPLQSVKCLIQ